MVELYSINGGRYSFNVWKNRIKLIQHRETVTGRAFQAYTFIKYLIRINRKQSVLYTLS